jgi:hypothetical protein
VVNQDLVAHFEAYSAWRANLSGSLTDLRNWLAEQGLNDAQTDLRLQHLLDRLRDDKLYVAFVAEFSRGKSELINTLFFADYKQRLLPSSAGRTTMCPTELLYEADKEPCIQLLPIETRASHAPTAEYKRHGDEWQTVPLDIQSREAMADAFKQVSQTKRVSVEDATRYGLYDADDDANLLAVGADGQVEIPAWRHAVINFPHPLLKQGLVILDTPGLNAIGTEPELTLNLLPNAHAVLFILAADTGVTKSDIEVWRNYIGNPQGQQKGRLVVLNKIDGLWDDLKSEAEIDRDIAQQVEKCAALLGLDTGRVYPVSAQKGLVAKIQDNAPLLERSRLPALERALSDELIPSKQEIVRDNIRSEAEDILAATRGILDTRLAGIREQADELNGLRDKNQEVILHMMEKVDREKEEFDKSLQRFQALRNVFSQQSRSLFTLLGLDAVRLEAENTRAAMQASLFTKSMREAMDSFFKGVNERIDKSGERVDEVKAMMDSIYQKFNEEHGISLAPPAPLSTLEYRKRIEKLEKVYQEHFSSTFNLLNIDKSTLINKFFETIANQVVQVFESANRHTEKWLAALISPMETQVREHQLQLRRRMESIKRIHKATATLEDRVEELKQMEAALLKQQGELEIIQQSLENALTLAPDGRHLESAA